MQQLVGAPWAPRPLRRSTSASPAGKPPRRCRNCGAAIENERRPARAAIENERRRKKAARCQPRLGAKATMATHHAPPHPALAHLAPTPRLLRLPQRDVAEPAPRAPTHLLRPFMAPAATKAAGVRKEEAVGWPTSSSPGCGRSTDSSSSDGNWQHASWERTRPTGVTHEAGDAAPERPPPVAVPALPWQRPVRAFTPAVTPREAGGGTLLSPGKSSSAKRSPSKNVGPDETTGGSPRRAAPDRSVLVPFDEPPFRPERTGPQALPEDVLQVCTRSNPSRPARPRPLRPPVGGAGCTASSATTRPLTLTLALTLALTLPLTPTLAPPLTLTLALTRLRVRSTMCRACSDARGGATSR